MSNKYSRVVLNGGNSFDLEGVRFSGKSFIFWKKKNVQNITEVAVIFDKKYENIQVNDNVAVLSLKGLTNYSDLSEAISIFREITQYTQFKFHFIIGNENERVLAEALGKNLGLIYNVKNMNNKIQEDIEQQRTMIEELKKQKDLSFNGNQTIEKYDNGTFKQITINNNVAYENIGYLNNEELRMRTLNEWKNDPVKLEELSRISEEERNKLLNKAVLSNQKEYRLEKPKEREANNRVEEVAIAKARQEDGLVNTELGIVQNNVSNSNKYSTIEQHRDEIRVVNPNVEKSNIHYENGAINSTETQGKVVNFNEYKSNVYMKNEFQQEREINQTFYLDEEGNIFQEDGTNLGKIGTNGYTMDYDNNTILKNGQTIGYIGDYREMGKTNSNANIYKKNKVHVLKPERDKRAAFVSLPVIIFILSALLLIVSAILLFVID